MAATIIEIIIDAFKTRVNVSIQSLPSASSVAFDEAVLTGPIMNSLMEDGGPDEP